MTMHDSIDVIVTRVNFFIMLCGVVCNLVCMCVLLQKKLLGRKFNYYLLVLALADFSFSVIVFVNYCVIYQTKDRAIYDLSRFTCYLTDYIMQTLDSFCVILTLIVSLDRFYAIINPVKLRLTFINRHPKNVAALCFLVLLVVHAPEIFLLQREYKTKDSQMLSNTIDLIKKASDSSIAINKTKNHEKLKGILNMLLSTHEPPRNETTVLTTLFATTTTPLKVPTKTVSNHIIESSVQYICIFKEALYEPSQYFIKFNRSTSYVMKHSPSGHQDPIRIAFIIYCKLLVTLLFTIVPAFAILVLNSALSYLIRQYIGHPESANSSNPASFANASTTSKRTKKKSKKKHGLTKTQQSQYLTIMMLGVWLLATLLPYYTLLTYTWAASLSLINDRSQMYRTIQAISSVFFNSNHCINLFIYLIFYREFRNCLSDMFKRIVWFACVCFDCFCCCCCLKIEAHLTPTSSKKNKPTRTPVVNVNHHHPVAANPNNRDQALMAEMRRQQQLNQMKDWKLSSDQKKKLSQKQHQAPLLELANRDNLPTPRVSVDLADNDKDQPGLNKRIYNSFKKSFGSLKKQSVKKRNENKENEVPVAMTVKETTLKDKRYHDDDEYYDEEMDEVFDS